MTIERKSLRWNGWGPVDQPIMIPDGAPHWISILTLTAEQRANLKKARTELLTGTKLQKG